MPDTLTMQQVADLAGVRRAVVSMWRSRYPTTEGGFPAPVDARSLTFSADAVGEWLTRTGRGNNPDAAVDAGLHSSRFATIREHLDAASGLLLLQALTGELLADLDAETALDAILDAQLPALLKARETLAALDDAALVADVDTLAEAGYGGERVLWRLVAAEHAPGGAFAEHSLTVDAAAMFTSLLRAVATADHHVVLHGQGALALLTQVAADIPADGTSSLGQGNRDDGDRDVRPLGEQFRVTAAMLARAWALAAGETTVERVRPQVRSLGEVREWMAKRDAADRVTRGEPIPEDIRLQLGALVVESTEATGVVDIYRAAGLEPPTLSDLSPTWIEEAAQPDRAQAAIDALKAQLLTDARTATAGNEVRSKLFSERVNELMFKYTNQQLTSAEVIAELVELAKEAAAEGRRGERFSPPLEHDELAFYDVVAENEAAVDVMGDDVLAQIARDLVAAMRRDTRIDWTVREDVRAKLRTTIRRLLRKYGYPPDEQPEAIVRVMQQMETLAPKCAEDAR